MSARVLVVDDDPQVRQLLLRVLELENLDAVTALNGCEGWQRLQETPVDLVISDLVMPELDGIELARRVRNHYGSAVKFILFSSLGTDPEQVAEAQDVDVFLPKPVAVLELIRVIRDLLSSLSYERTNSRDPQ